MRHLRQVRQILHEVSANCPPASPRLHPPKQGTSMPLPNILSQTTPQCRARSKRSGVRCWNPAAFGMPVCRFHGARRSGTIQRGSDHPQYRHGQETLEMKRAHQEASVRLRHLETLAHLLRITHGKRTPGPKPSGYKPKTQGERNG